LAHNFEAQSEHSGDTAVLRVAGEFDTNAAADFQREIDRVIAAGPQKILIDLRGLTFMDSTGIRMILSAQSSFADASSNGHFFGIVPGPGSVSRVLEVAGVYNLIPAVAPEQVPLPRSLIPVSAD